MKVVGLTGGIGSGKSYVANIFNSLFSIPIYNSDIRAKYLMQNDVNVKNNIVEILGEESYNDNTLNKSFIAEKIFNNIEFKKKIDNIIHPIVKEDFQKWKSEQYSKYVIKESAILFESNAHLYCDFVITVFCDLEERIGRVSLRDGHSEDYILKIMENQLDEEKKKAKSDFVINNFNNSNLEEQVKSINKFIINNIK